MAFDKIKKGKILVEIKIVNTERLLNVFWSKNIRVYKIKRKDAATLVLEIDYLDYAKVREIVVNLGGRINIIKSNGFVFFLGGIKKRMSLAIGSVLFLGIIFYLSTYIWSIEVEVQKNIPPFEIRKGKRKYKYNNAWLYSYAESSANYICTSFIGILRNV